MIKKLISEITDEYVLPAEYYLMFGRREKK